MGLTQRTAARGLARMNRNARPAWAFAPHYPVDSYMRRFRTLAGQQLEEPSQPRDATFRARSVTAQRRFLWSRPSGWSWRNASTPAPRDMQESVPYVNEFQKHRGGDISNVVGAYVYGSKQPHNNGVQILKPGDDRIVLTPGLVFCRGVALHLKEPDNEKLGEEKLIATFVIHFAGQDKDQLAKVIGEMKKNLGSPKSYFELAAVHAGPLFEWGIGLEKEHMDVATTLLLERIQPNLSMKYDSIVKVNKGSTKGEAAAQELQPAPQGWLKDLFPGRLTETIRTAFFSHTKEGFEHFSVPEAHIKKVLDQK